MVVQIYHPRTWEAEAGGLDYKFKTSLGYIVRLCLTKQNKTKQDYGGWGIREHHKEGHHFENVLEKIWNLFCEFFTLGTITEIIRESHWLVIGEGLEQPKFFVSQHTACLGASVVWGYMCRN
jgi:hypothetical protein